MGQKGRGRISVLQRMTGAAAIGIAGIASERVGALGIA
jgi:hypothetical protein